MATEKSTMCKAVFSSRFIFSGLSRIQSFFCTALYSPKKAIYSCVVTKMS